MKNPILSDQLVQTVVTLIDKAKVRVASTINRELTLLYWHIGHEINEYLKIADKGYGKKVVDALSKELTSKYGAGYSRRNVYNFMLFNELYPDESIVQTLSAQLSWSHIYSLLPIKEALKREFYIQMCRYELWSVRTLQNRITSQLYERTAISKKPEQTIIKDLAQLKGKQKMSSDLIFKDPYVLNFLGLADTYSERDLESAILLNLQKFIVELGTDFAFIARQKRIIIDNEDFYIDLLFYHRSLKCLVVIDLKLDKFKASYKGQMELYLRWLEKNEMREGEQMPIGLILCSEKSPEQIEYLMLGNGQIKVAEYLTQLPDKELLSEKLEKAIALAKARINKD